MNEQTVFYDEKFFAEQERPPSLRELAVRLIKQYCATADKTYSFGWRKAYLELEDRTGFRVPDKQKLDAVERAGLMAQLLEVARSLFQSRSDHANEVTAGIPDCVPHESPVRRLVQIQHEPIEVTPYRSPHPHRRRDQESEAAPAGSQPWPYA